MRSRDQFCRKCGKAIPIDAKFCIECGQTTTKLSQIETRPSFSGYTENEDKPDRFQMRDGFILNTQTGDVWKYDETSGKLKIVEKEDSMFSLLERVEIYRDLHMKYERLALQNDMQMESRQYNAVSNALKVRHDSEMAAINNLK